MLEVCECLPAVLGNSSAAPGGATPSPAITAWLNVGVLESLPDRNCNACSFVLTRLILTLAWVSLIQIEVALALSLLLKAIFAHGKTLSKSALVSWWAFGIVSSLSAVPIVESEGLCTPSCSLWLHYWQYCFQNTSKTCPQPLDCFQNT